MIDTHYLDTMPRCLSLSPSLGFRIIIIILKYDGTIAAVTRRAAGLTPAQNSTGGKQRKAGKLSHTNSLTKVRFKYDLVEVAFSS